MATWHCLPPEHSEAPSYLQQSRGYMLVRVLNPEAVKIHSKNPALPLGINEATEWHCVPTSVVDFRV